MSVGQRRRAFRPGILTSRRLWKAYEFGIPRPEHVGFRTGLRVETPRIIKAREGPRTRGSPSKSPFCELSEAKKELEPGAKPRATPP